MTEIVAVVEHLMHRGSNFGFPGAERSVPVCTQTTSSICVKERREVGRNSTMKKCNEKRQTKLLIEIGSMRGGKTDPGSVNSHICCAVNTAWSVEDLKSILFYCIIFSPASHWGGFEEQTVIPSSPQWTMIHVSVEGRCTRIYL